MQQMDLYIQSVFLKDAKIHLAQFVPLGYRGNIPIKISKDF